MHCAVHDMTREFHLNVNLRLASHPKSAKNGLISACKQTKELRKRAENSASGLTK